MSPLTTDARNDNSVDSQGQSGRDPGERPVIPMKARRKGRAMPRIAASRKNWTVRDTETGEDLLRFRSMTSVRVNAPGRVLSYPVEGGGFISYGKAEAPLEVDVTLSFVESPAGNDIRIALETLDAMRKKAVTYSLVTPGKEYEDLTLTGVDYRRRREDGVNCLYATLHGKEVRQLPPQRSPGYISREDARNPSAASTVDRGSLQAQELDDSIARLIPGRLPAKRFP